MKFFYFDGYGRGEDIRMILSYNKVAFEDCRHSFESWGKIKFSGQFEFNQMPALEIDGKTYC